MIALGLTHSSCHQEVKDNLVKRLTGAYINPSESKWSVSMDTVIIHFDNPKAGVVVIVHKTGFHPKRNGILQPKEYEEESSVAVLDVENLQLKEQRHGLIYSLPASFKELILGTTQYKKIN